MYSPLADVLYPPFIASMDGVTRRSIRLDAFKLGNYGDVDAARQRRRELLVFATQGVLLGGVTGWLFGPVFGAITALLASVPVVISAVRLGCSFYPAQALPVVAAMIRHRRCPACAHSLLAGEDGSGTLSCGECGAVWNEDVSEWLLTGGGVELHGGGKGEEEDEAG